MVVTHVGDGGGRRKSRCLPLLAAQGRLLEGRQLASQEGERRLGFGGCRGKVRSSVVGLRCFDSMKSEKVEVMEEMKVENIEDKGGGL